jgi:hypothetical protein
MKHVEFRVRPVTRYNLTRYESDDSSGSVCTVAEFPNWDAAHEVALAMQAGAPGAIYAPSARPPDEEIKPVERSAAIW